MFQLRPILEIHSIMVDFVLDYSLLPKKKFYLESQCLYSVREVRRWGYHPSASSM